jgi:rhomboid family GlyGly-CTERM serine protease
MGLGEAGSRRTLDVRGWLLPAGLAALSIAFELTGDAGRHALRFDRGAIEAGEWWRLATGHLVHLGWNHLGMNIAGLALVWLLSGKAFSVGHWCLVLAATLAGIDLGLWVLDPELSWYVGLSGLLHGMLMAGIVAGVSVASTDAKILGLLIVGKIAWEQWFGPLPGSEGLAGAPVVVNAHLYGAVAGAAIAAILIRVRRHRPI